MSTETNANPFEGASDVGSAAEALMSRLESKRSKPGAEQDDAQNEPESEQESTDDTGTDATAEAETAEIEEEEAEESEEEEPGQKAEADPKFKVRIGDEDKELPLSELKRGYMMQADYTRKTQEVAEHRKQFIAKATEYEQGLQQRVGEIGFLAQTLMQQLTETQQTTNWQQLRAENPAEYAARQHDLQAKQQLLQRSFNAYQQAQNAQKELGAQKSQQHLAEQAELLVTKVPEWLDPAVAKKEKAQLAKHLADSGFSPEEITALSDHRLIVLARKAMLADQMAGVRAEAKAKAEKIVPKLNRGGAIAPANDPSLKAAKRFKSSGKVEDGALWLLSKHSRK